jgi:excisionase family DNA binding protein
VDEDDVLPRSKLLIDALNRARQNNLSEKLTLSVDETCKITGISRWMVYELINSGKLKSLKIGSRRLIRMTAIQKYLEELEKEGGG